MNASWKYILLSLFILFLERIRKTPVDRIKKNDETLLDIFTRKIEGKKLFHHWRCYERPHSVTMNRISVIDWKWKIHTEEKINLPWSPGS